MIIIRKISLFAEDRRQQAEIAEQIIDSGLDVLIGGGWKYFIPQSNEGSGRSDNKNLLQTLETHMPVALSYDRLPDPGDKLAALLAPDGLPKSADRDYSLATLTEAAIEILSKNRKGFVLLVEGSQIGWAAHNQEPEGVIAEMIDFDDAVDTGLDFAQKHGDTLIVVTAVHDGSMQTRQITATGFTSSGHTAAMVPIFAIGPGSNQFNGIQGNAQVGRAIISQLLKTDVSN